MYKVILNDKYYKAYGSLFLVGFIAGLASDIYWPAINHLIEDFCCSTASVQLGMGINFVFPAIMGFSYGVIADKFGSKTALLLGTQIICIGNLGCYLAPDVFWFNLSRCIEGIGLGGVSIISSVLFIKLNKGKKVAWLLSMNGTMLALGLILSPFVGSILIKFFHWKMSFVLIMLMCLVATYVIYVTVPNIIHEHNQHDIIKSIRLLLGDVVFIRNNLILSLPMAGLFSINVALPIYYLQKIQMDPMIFAYHKGLGPIICLLISFYVRNIIYKLGLDASIRIGNVFTIIGSLIIFLSVILWPSNVYAITFGVTLYSFLFPFIFPVILTKNLDLYQGIQGLSSAVCYSLRTAFVCLGVAASSILYYNGNLKLISGFMLILALMSFTLQIQVVKRYKC